MRSGSHISRRSAARGFTVVELVLALALSALLVMSALSIMWMLTSTDDRLARRFDDQSELIITQMVVRRAMGSLIAAKPKDPEQAAQGKPVDEDESQSEFARNEADQQNDDLRSLIASVTGDNQLAMDLITGIGSDRPNFELYYEPSGGLMLPALEVKVMESPVPPPADAPRDELVRGIEQFLPVRGVFETLELGDGLALQWRPIDPPGPPTLLIRDLAAIEWYCLPHKQDWVDVYAAYLKASFPAGVRLVMWTNNGTHVDWFFDAAITTPEGP